MKKLKKLLVGFVGFLSLIIVFNYTGNHITFGTYSTKEIDSNWIEIKRKKYPFRNWYYSGIFPAGDFVKDPYINSMGMTWPLIQPFEFDDEIKNFLDDQNARYQVYDINLPFGKNYHETILAIEIKKNIFEYRIEDEEIEGGFTNNFNAILPSFLFDNRIIFLSDFNISNPKSYSIFDKRQPRFFTVDLPLKNNQIIKTIKPKSKDGQKIMSYLITTKRYKFLKNDLCRISKNKVMIKFYEQFEPC